MHTVYEQRVWMEWAVCRRVLFQVTLACFTAGCSSEGASPDEAAGGSIFGGTLGSGSAGLGGDGPRGNGLEGNTGGNETGLARGGNSAGGSSGTANLRCSGVPLGGELRIDDFEDGNAIPRPAPDRQGFWNLQHDDTDGTATPDGTPDPVAGGANGTDYALHVVADGFADWGMNIDVHLNTLSGGLSCPYNAGNTRGIGVYLKGSGQVRIGASTAGIVTTEFGGTCTDDQVCWDAHVKLVPLTETWTYREIPWDSLAQVGWGTYVDFDPGQLKTVRFGALPADLPLDVWLDEVRFLPLEVAADAAPAGE